MLRVCLLLACVSLITTLPLPMLRLIKAAATTATAPPVITDLSQLATPGKHRVEFQSDDHARKFVIYIPTHFNPSKPLPVVFFFHGMGGNSEQAAHTYGWVEKAEQENFIAVFPEGLGVAVDRPANFLMNPNIWRDERPDIPSTVNDVHFFETLLIALETHLPIDPHRVYVTGFSNGAGMTFTLGSHFSDRIAAIAPVSSQSLTQIKSLTRPLPVYYLVGTSDPLIPFHGGPITLPWGASRSFPPVQNTIDLWVGLDGCPSVPQTVSEVPGVTTLRYGPGNAKAEILFTAVEGNGHHWPGSHEPLPRSISGPVLDPFNATDRIWDFFVRHPLP